MDTQRTLLYTFVDTESSWDRDLIAANQAIHPDCQHNRIGSRIIDAAAIFDVDIGGDGTVSFGAVKSWSKCTHKTDRAVTKALFDNLTERSERTVVTWGGLPADQQILTISAMEYGLVLPPQFRERTFATRHRMHLDLSLAMKAGSKTWHHLRARSESSWAIPAIYDSAVCAGRRVASWHGQVLPDGNIGGKGCGVPRQHQWHRFEVVIYGGLGLRRSDEGTKMRANPP